MYQTGYHATDYYATDYYLHGQVVEVPVGGGGGGTQGSGPGFAPSPRPSIDKIQPLLLAQARQEDEDLIYILKAFTEVTRWH
jgi:hypothetical protein